MPLSHASLLHKERLQPKIFTNVSETAVTFACQVLGMVTEKVLKHCYFNTSSVFKPAISTFCYLGSSAFTRHYYSWQTTLWKAVSRMQASSIPKTRERILFRNSFKVFVPGKAIPNVLTTAKLAFHSKSSLVLACPKLWEGLHHIALLLGTLTGAAQYTLTAWEGRTSRGKLRPQHSHSMALSETSLFFFFSF